MSETIKMRLPAIFLAAVLSSFVASMSWAATYYVAPLGATLSGTADGSLARPWPSVAAAIKSGRISGGDTVMLMDGSHGMLTFHSIAFSSPVIFQSLNAKNAHVERIKIQQGNRNLTFRNLTVWPSNPSASLAPLIVSYTESSDITLDSLDVRGTQNAATTYLNWSVADWLAQGTVVGAHLRGPRSTVLNSTFVGIGIGIATSGADAVVVGNRIEGFSADGMRGFGDRSLFQNNHISNCVKINNNQICFIFHFSKFCIN